MKETISWILTICPIFIWGYIIYNHYRFRKLEKAYLKSLNDLLEETRKSLKRKIEAER